MINVKIVEDEIIHVNIISEMTNIPANPYTGSYEVTPSNEEQTLQTSDKHLTNNVIVHKIPNNYGLITYNGYELLIS